MKRLFVIFIALALSCGAAFSQKKEAYHVRTVVIDPGHGGAKPGAQGSRSQEKDITLAVAKKFGTLIHDNYPDVKVIYTRTTDVDISLGERARIANRNKADLFISIHANSHPTSTPTGVETFVMGLSKSASNLEVAKKENADILLEADYKTNKDYAGFDPNSDESYIIFTLAQNAYLEKSLNFAQAIQTQYKNNMKTINRGVKQAELFVLYKTAMPAVLTEIGFISNPTEEAYMLSKEGQANIAICLFNAFMNYKVAEEGGTRIANPVINIEGYKAPAVAAKPKERPKEEPKVEPKEQPKEVAQKMEKPAEPAVVEKPVAEEKPAAVEPVKEKPVVVEPVKEEPAPAVAEKVTPVAAKQQEKPLPAVTLPPVQEKKAEPKAEPKVEPKAEPKAELKVEPEPVVKQEPQPKPEPKQEPKPEPVPEPTPVVKETLQDPQNTAAPDATKYYTVQFLTTAELYPKGAPELDGISVFTATKQGKKYAYNTGRFNTIDEAREYCNHIKNATQFKDAWAHIFQEPANTAVAQTEPTKPTQAPATPEAKPTKPAQTVKTVPGLTYRVQFCTSDKQMKDGDPDLKGIKNVYSAPAGNSFVHTTGDFKTFSEAQQRCNTIKRTTRFRDAFVIAIYNGERISLSQAQAMQKKNK